MIKNSLRIYKRDLKIIFTNYVVLIVVVALSIIPSLYAWINIKASWDPYSESATSRIIVDVVNNDKGASINNKEINLGNNVVDGLKENALLGWRFVTFDEANDDLNNEKVFAALVLPENFSENISSLITNDIKKAEIKYMVNEKLNAIAPKITIKGATGVQSTVKDEVIKTTSEAALSIVSELGIEIEENLLPKLVEASGILHNIIDNYGKINNDINGASDIVNKVHTYTDNLEKNMPELEEILSKFKTIVYSVDDYSDSLMNSFNEISPTLKTDIGIAQNISSNISSSVIALENAIKNGSNEAPIMLENLLNKIDELNNLVTSIEKIVKIMGNTNPILVKLQSLQTSLTNLRATIQELKNKVDSGIELDYSKLENIKTASENISNFLGDLYNNYDTSIKGNIDKVFSNLSDKVNKTRNIVDKAEAELPDISSLVTRINEILVKGNNSIIKVEEVLPTVEEKVTDITNKIDEAINSKELADILNLVINQVSNRVDFLTSPVEVIEETLYPMGNYGSQMTPFYSTLACWVGLTFLVSILSVETEGDYKPMEVYLGKMLTFTSISIVQSMIIALGDIYYLKIYCLNKGLFFVGMLVIAIVFSIIVYSLVSVFGNVGKVVAIVLMIFQVAASGGTFPVQLTSNFFIAINPYLPFTYAISFLRESIGGVVESVLYKDIRFLVICSIIAILVSIICKRKANELMKHFNEKFEKSGLE